MAGATVGAARGSDAKKFAAGLEARQNTISARPTTISSSLGMMMSWTDLRRLASYRRALAAFEDGYRLSGHRAERIEVTNQQGAPLGGVSATAGPARGSSLP